VKYYKIEPVDSLFFRDGSPYNMDETQNDVKSIFPPTPYTMAGALRASIARDMGWVSGDWTEDIKDKLGDGKNLGKLNFFGPYILKDDEPIFMVPRTLMGKKSDDGSHWELIRKMIPGEPITRSDMGENIRYPSLTGNEVDMKNITGFISGKDLLKILWADDLDGIEIISDDDVYQFEFNVGIKRDDDLRVDDGGLFSRRFVRLNEGNRDESGKKDAISILAGIDGIDSEVSGHVMLGGESKAAFVDGIDPIKLPEPDDDTGLLKEFVVLLITPARIPDLSPGGNIEGLPGDCELVSVCADRPQMIGGWDHNKGPQPLRAHLKPGSILFMRSREGIDPKQKNGIKIGKDTEFGFGQIIIGKW